MGLSIKDRLGTAERRRQSVSSSILQISRQQALTNIFDPYLLMTTFVGLIENPNLMYFFYCYLQLVTAVLCPMCECALLFSASIALSKQALKGCCMIYCSLFRRNKRSIVLLWCGLVAYILYTYICFTCFAACHYYRSNTTEYCFHFFAPIVVKYKM